MNLPNYFLADLPPEASLTANLLAEACDSLRRNRETYLASRSTQSLISLLTGVASEWLDQNYPLRRLALQEGPAALGFSAQTLASGLDVFFRQITTDNLEALIGQDLSHVLRLDRPVANAHESRANKTAFAITPEFLLHITAGNLPPPALTSMVLGVLVRSAQFVKCATGASLIPRLFAHSLYQADSKLGACIEVAEWKGGNEVLEKAVLDAADCVTATGSDKALDAIRPRIPAGKRFLEYGHRVSFGYVAADMLRGPQLREAVSDAAKDVAAWDQLGCLSPHAIFVEDGGTTPPSRFAEMLAEELQRLETEKPRGKLTAHEEAAVASRRSFYELRAAHSLETRLWQSPGSTAWTVVFESAPIFQPSCMHRFIYVKQVSGPDEAMKASDAVRTKISTVGLAAGEGKWHELAESFGRWGASRVCALGRMQAPPLHWRHDGRPALGDLVRWVDLELK